MKTLVLSSAATNFPFILGRLHAIRDELHEIEHIVGTSAGGIIGTLIAARFEPLELFEWIEDRKLVKETVLRCNPFNLLFTTYLIDNEWIVTLLSTLLQEKGLSKECTLAEFAKEKKVRLTLPVFNISQGLPEMFDSDTHPNLKVVDALLATSAIPFIFPPVRCNDQWYCDGALTHSFPSNVIDSDPETTLGIAICNTPLGIDKNILSWKWIPQTIACAANFVQREFHPPAFKTMYIRHSHLPFSHYDGPAMFKEGLDADGEWLK